MSSYKPEELFDLPRQALSLGGRGWFRSGPRRMSANPHAQRGGLLRPLVLPDFRDYAVSGREAGDGTSTEPTRVLGEFLRDVIAAATPTRSG